MTINPQPASEDQWTDCPSGEIGGLVTQLQTKRRHKTRRTVLRRTSVGISCLAILGMTGLYAIPPFKLAEPNFGGITCSEVKSQADEFLAGRLKRDDAAQIDVHLAACDHCRSFMTELRNRRHFDEPTSVETVGRRDQAADSAGFLLARSGH